MKLPTHQEFKRIGTSALKNSLDPSAVERGLQYLREGGLVSVDLNAEKSTLQVSILTIKNSEGNQTEVELSSVSKPMYSSCDCSMAGYAIFCKHQALAAWCIACYACQNYDLTRVDEPILQKVKSFEGHYLQALQRLKSKSPLGSYSHNLPPELSAQASSLELPASHLSNLYLSNLYLSNSDLATYTADLSHIVVHLPFEHCSGEFKKYASHEVPYAQGPSLLPDISISYLRETDLPHSLWRSPLSFKSTQVDPLHDLRLKRSLIYVFTDHVQVPVSEILYHPYAKLLPTDLLPIASNIKEEYHHHKGPFPFLISRPKNHHEERLNFILISVLQQAYQYSLRGKLKLFLADQNEFDKTQLAAPLTQLQWVNLKNPQHGHAPLSSIFQLVSKGPFQVDLVLTAPPQSLWEHSFSFSHSQHLLAFHLDSEWRERYPDVLTLDAPSKIESIFEELQTQHGVDLSRIHTQPKLRVEPVSPASCALKVYSNGTLAFQWESCAGIVDGLPQPILKIFQSLQDGIRSTQDAAMTYMSDTKKNTRRSSDLRLLKHSGVAQVVYQETLRQLMNASLTHFDVFFDDLKKKVALYLNKLDGTPTQGHISLELFCSKPAIEFLEHYCRDLKNLYEDRLFPVFSPQGNVLYRNVYSFYLKVLYAWSLQHPVLNPFFSKSENWQELTLISAEAPPQKFILNAKDASFEPYIKSLLPLQNEGCSLYLDDESVEELMDGDFVSEFILEEHQDPLNTAFQKIDWFELHPKFFFKGVEVNEEQALKLSQTGLLSFQGKVYRLNPGSVPSLEKLTNFWDQLSQQFSTSKRQRKSDKVYKLQRHSILELLILRESGVHVRGGSYWDSICLFYDSLKQERPTLQLPTSFKGELKPYQYQGVQWIHDLYRLGLGGILADDMGLGKTVQTLAFFDYLFEQKDLHHCLIIVPTSLTYNWFSESERFSPHLPMHIFHSREIPAAHQFLKGTPQGVMITTYGLLAEHEGFFNQYRWNIHIYDEAQNLKTITAKRTTVSRKTPARFKLCLTGTPLENHLGEFYSLVDLALPGALGAYEQFRKSFLNSYAPEPERIQHLKAKTRPLVLRRTKNAILKELPEKTESTVRIPFTDKQRTIYRNIALSWNNRVKKAINEQGEGKSQLIMLTALLRLRQACSSPASIPSVTYHETPPKVSLLVDNLKDIVESGESALVFTQFLGTFEILEKEMKKAAIPFYAIHGKVTRKERELNIQKFKDSQEGAVMLMTLKTGGVGLNLTKASYVFHLEPWWNPAVENQATDRTHRIGQTKPVQVYRYIMSESVEEKIEILKQRKSAQFASLFSEAENEQQIDPNVNLHLTQKDFEYLLS